jgi:hypothetical protein
VPFVRGSFGKLDTFDAPATIWAHFDIERFRVKLARCFGRVALLASLALPSAAMAQTPPTPLPPPTWQNGRIRYDSQCMTIDGKDQLIFSGAFHYFRCPKELWAKRFETLKAAGFNTLETYAAWNYHEQQPPKNVNDFSQMNTAELHDWLAMAIDTYGFNVILRPGPYICAEWDGGGYPQWLLNKRPSNYEPKEWYRSADPNYLAWCKHWYTAVAKEAVPFQITHRPAGKAGIIEWQIENEYDYSDQPIDTKVKQLVYLAHTSRDLGIDIPLMTCVTNNEAFHKDPYLRENVLQTANSYPGFNMQNFQHDLDSIKFQTDKFKAVTELQGGWFAQVGGKLSEAQGYDETQINHITVMAWSRGFTSTNYYMGFGGSNFADWPSLDLTQTYDYDAPVRESGGTTARYQAVKALGQFVTEHGVDLARSTPLQPIRDQKGDVSVSARRGRDGSRFVFVMTDERGGDRTGKMSFEADGPLSFNYNLGSFGAKVLYLPPGSKSDNDGGVWYPKEQPAVVRPADLPEPITITEAKTKIDDGPANGSTWKPIYPDQTETAAGVWNRMYVYYKAKVDAATGEDKTKSLRFTTGLSGKDWVSVTVDGKPVTGEHGSYALNVTADTPHTVAVLYDNAGRPNFGDGLETPSGLLNPQITVDAGTPITIGGWKMHLIGNLKNAKAETGESFDDSAWTAADVTAEDGTLKPGESAIYRATVDVPAADLKLGRMLSLGRIDDEGTVYVNGFKAGESKDWNTPVKLDVSGMLRAGKNTIAVSVKNVNGAGGLSKGTSLDPIGTPLPVEWQISQAAAGTVGHWDAIDLDDSAWKSVPIGKDQPGSGTTGLTWYRMKFSVPDPKPNEFVPWRITLAATGNGYVYLNGHNLGRFWEVGPQHDYYLPECWLNFGAGKTNVVTMEMRPGTTSAAIRSAVVQPWQSQAEVRPARP